MGVSRVVWCRACEIGLECGRGAPPPTCPRKGCGADGHWWTPTPPFRLTKADRKFLESIHVEAEASNLT